MLLVAVGLGAIVAASATAYTVIKVAGAAYVIWLGIQAIRHRGEARQALESSGTDARPSLRIGFIVGRHQPEDDPLLRRLPAAVHRHCRRPVGVQMALLGVVFGVMAIGSDSIWALLAAKARDWFARKPHRLDRLGAAGGAMMVGLGVTLLARE